MENFCSSIFQGLIGLNFSPLSLHFSPHVVPTSLKGGERHFRGCSNHPPLADGCQSFAYLCTPL